MGEPDYGRFDEDQLCCAMDQMNGLHNAALGQLFRILSVYEQKHSCAQDGMRSSAEWLCQRYGLSSKTARAWSEAAQKLEQFPLLAQAFSSGRLSLDKLELLLPVVSKENEAELLEEASRLNLGPLRSLVRRLKPVTHEDDKEAHEQRFLNWVWHENYVRLWGKLRPDQGARVIKALERGAHLIGRNPEGGWDSTEQLSADALVELCSQALAQDQDPDRATVVIHADVSTLVAPEGVALSEEGVALSSEALRRTLCDCRLQIAAHDHNGDVIGTGSLSRSVRRWLLRRLRERDQGCVFPGCSRRRFLQAHHVKHWSRGGPTEEDNLCLLCGYHHHLLHEGGWNMSFDGSSAPVFLRPTGEVFEPGPEPLWDELFGRFFWDVEPETADTS